MVDRIPKPKPYTPAEIDQMRAVGEHFADVNEGDDRCSNVKCWCGTPEVPREAWQAALVVVSILAGIAVVIFGILIGSE